MFYCSHLPPASRHKLPLTMLLALLVLPFSASPAHTGETPPAPAATTAPERQTIDVLLLGYYIWAFPKFVERARAEGINLYGPLRPDPTGADPANYPVEFLKKFHVVIASGPLEKAWDPQMIRTGIKPGIVNNLLEYNRQGGGLVWIPLGAGYGAFSWNESIGNRIGAQALDEGLDDPVRDVKVALMASFSKDLRYIWTTDIKPHPITAGVRGLFFGRRGEWGWPGVLPVKCDPTWEVLVRGMDTTRSVRNATPPESGKRSFEYSAETGAYAENPQIIAARAGMAERKGRMLLQPIYTTWTWGNYGHPGMKEAFLLNGDGVNKSDGLRFLLNGWRWLAEPAFAASGFGGYVAPAQKTVTKPLDLSPVVWKEPDWNKLTGEPSIRGIFGARSKHGGGAGTVEEWAAAARACGLDYLVFTDDPNTHTPESYQALIADCKKNSDTKFAIVPGWGAHDINRVFRFYPGAPHLPNRVSFAKDGKLAKPVGATVDYGWTIGQIAGEMGKMPYNPWWEHVIMACAPLTYAGGKLIDDSVLSWLKNCEANNSNLLPVSLVRVDDPAQLAAVLKDAHRTVLRTSDASTVKEYARKGAGGNVLPSYMTSGPEIIIWRGESSPGEPYRPSSSRFRILLKTHSDAGLAEVKIINAADGSVYRLWKPAGAKDFSVSVDESTTDQHVYGLIITDTNGHTAIPASLYRFQSANRVWLMGDRLMGLHHIQGWDEKREALVTYGSPTGINYHKGDPIGGGEFSTDHSANLKFQGLEGDGIYPPAFKLHPALGAATGSEPAGLVMRFVNRLSGHDLTVLDYIGDKGYAGGAKFDFNSTPPVLQDTKYADITSRTWNVIPNYMSPVNIMLTEITAVFKQEVDLKRLYLGRYTGPDETGEFDLLTIRPGSAASSLSWLFNQGDQFTRETEFLPGGYLYQARHLAGTMGFIALDDKIAATSHARRHEFRLSKKYLTKYRAGDRLTVRMLRVARAYDQQQGSNEWLEQFLRDYGIATAPSYQYELLQGTLRGINYIVDLDQTDGGAVFKLKKFPLPQPLPVRVNGIIPNSICGEYDLDTLRVRPLPCFEESVTAAIDPRQRDLKLYLGEWLRWDNSNVRVSMVTDGADFLLEAHNPTDREIVCNLSGAKGFAPLREYQKQMRLAPYTSVKERIVSAPGTVKLVAFK